MIPGTPANAQPCRKVLASIFSDTTFVSKTIIQNRVVRGRVRAAGFLIQRHPEARCGSGSLQQDSRGGASAHPSARRLIAGALLLPWIDRDGPLGCGAVLSLRHLSVGS